MSGDVTKYPAVDLLVKKASAAQSVATALLELAKAGRLGELERDIAAMRRVVDSGGQLVKGPAPAGALAKSAAAAVVVAKADEYQAKAYVVSDPQLRNGYLELAAQERQR